MAKVISIKRLMATSNFERAFTRSLQLFLSCFGAIIILSVFQNLAQAADAQPKAGVMLKGQVEHHDTLPALDEGLQSGVPFAESALEKRAKYKGKWIKIPAWFAGTFQTTETYLEDAFDYATGQRVQLKRTIPSAGQEQRGQQKDAKGGIWHYYVESGASRSEQPGHITYSTIDWYGPEVLTNERVVMRILATSLVVDRNTGVIVDSFQREDLKTYVPKDDGISVRYTSKSFDSRGNPRDLQTGRSIHQRIAPFTICDETGAMNYRESFKEYLELNQLANLLPKK